MTLQFSSKVVNGASQNVCLAPPVMTQREIVLTPSQMETFKELKLNYDTTAR